MGTYSNIYVDRALDGPGRSLYQLLILPNWNSVDIVSMRDHSNAGLGICRGLERYTVFDQLEWKCRDLKDSYVFEFLQEFYKDILLSFANNLALQSLESKSEFFAIQCDTCSKAVAYHWNYFGFDSRWFSTEVSKVKFLWEL